MPKGVSSPCGLVTVMTEPTFAPSSSAMSLPRTMGGRDVAPVSLVEGVASSAAAEPCFTVSRIVLTLRSSAE